MPTILGAAAGGMVHNQDVLDTVSHNLANANAVAYKKYRALHEGVADAAATPEGGRLGVANTTRDLILAPATLQVTEDPMHFAIEDRSFLTVMEPDGSPLYTRVGGLRSDGRGTIVAPGGREVPDVVTGEAIRLPDGWTGPAIDDKGVVTAIDQAGQRGPVGQVRMVQFVNPEGLEVLGGGLYAQSLNSGGLTVATAGSEGFAPLRAGALESSNVDAAEEFTNMLIAQRAYSACAKTFSIGDEMIALATKITQ